VLRDELGWAMGYLRWLSHPLDGNHMSERVILSHHLLQALQGDEEQHFRNIVTGDESWFFLETPITFGLSRSRNDFPS
jgi:hypothetical protein